jgi:hypothetical protein
MSLPEVGSPVVYPLTLRIPTSVLYISPTPIPRAQQSRSYRQARKLLFQNNAVTGGMPPEDCRAPLSQKKMDARRASALRNSRESRAKPHFAAPPRKRSRRSTDVESGSTDVESGSADGDDESSINDFELPETR